MKKDFLDNPKNIKLIVRGLVVCCAILLGLDLILHRHSVHPWEEVFGFYAFYGFIACVVLVLLAKEQRKLIMRDEDYYVNKEQGEKNDD